MLIFYLANCNYIKTSFTKLVIILLVISNIVFHQRKIRSRKYIVLVFSNYYRIDCYKIYI